MRVESSRFGMVEVDQEVLIRFPKGLIGFPQETRFVLLRRDNGSPVGWLQSAQTPELAFPVVSVDSLDFEYPDVPPDEIASYSGVPGQVESMAIMAVVTASSCGTQATVNLLSPIVVNAETRTGAQVILERSSFSTQEPFRIRRRPTPVVSEVQPAPLSP